MVDEPDPRLVKLAQYLTFLEQTEEDIARFKTRLEHVGEPGLRRIVTNDIARLKARRSAQILLIERQLRAHLDLGRRLDLVLSVPGIGKRTAIVALVLYALLPILRNTYVGLTSIDPAILESAEAMGMTRGQIMLRVRFPLALSVILAGVRTATVLTIGVATIAAAIGAGGLGSFIFRGVAMVSDALLLAGAIPAALLAILADFLLGLIERRLRVT